MDLSEARKLKELERENGELKKMLAEALLKNRVLEAVAEKNGRPGASSSGGPRRGSAWAVLRADGVPLLAPGSCHTLVSRSSTLGPAGPAGQAAAYLERSKPSLRLPAHRRPATPGRMDHRQAPSAAPASGRRPARAAHSPQTCTPGCFHRTAHQGHPARTRMDLGLCERCHGARRRTQECSTILDKHTRECHVLRPDRALRSADVLAWLERAIKAHGAPRFLRSDNGPEFVAKEVQRWLAKNQVETIYIEPGSPWQNGCVKSFHGQLRDEYLNQEQLWTLIQARVVIEDYCCHYNERRPHGKLGYQSPARFAAAQSQLTPASFAEAGQNHPIQIQSNQSTD